MIEPFLRRQSRQPGSLLNALAPIEKWLYRDNRSPVVAINNSARKKEKGNTKIKLPIFLAAGVAIVGDYVLNPNQTLNEE